MPFPLTPFIPTLIYLFTSTPLVNESSFRLTSPPPTLVSAVAAFAGAIIGSVVSGYYLIMKVREEKRLEFFSDVFDNFYAPFQETTKAVIDKNEISAETRRKLQELIYKNRKWIILCPDSIKKSTNDLFKNLRDKNYEGALKKINILKKEIDKITDKISFK